MSRTRRGAVTVDGVVLLDKPAGLTSNAALQRVRRALNAAKAGHTGTLDPLATGLLPICLGEATKFSALLLDADKTYLADIRFGITTTTGDAEGEVVERGDVSVLSAAGIEAVFRGLAGTMDQVPPMYSALKHQGRALYEYARAGETVERAARSITIHEVAIVAIRPEWVRVRLRVSKGTYIRTVAEEAGRRLGCGRRRHNLGLPGLHVAGDECVGCGQEGGQPSAVVEPDSIHLAAGWGRQSYHLGCVANPPPVQSWPLGRRLRVGQQRSQHERRRGNALPFGPACVTLTHTLRLFYPRKSAFS